MVLVLCDLDTHFNSVKACQIKTERTVWSVKKEHGLILQNLPCPVLLNIIDMSLQIRVHYKLEYNPECSTATPPEPVAVMVKVDSTALDVMQQAVIDYKGKEKPNPYQFQATFFSFGYFIDQLNRSQNTGYCNWTFYYSKPGGPEVLADVGVSSFHIPESGYSIILKYEHQDH